MKILSIILIIIILMSCSSPITARGKYSYDSQIDYEILDSSIVISKDGKKKLCVKYEKIADRVLKFDINGKSVFSSIFDENCFKPRKVRSIIFSYNGGEFIPYNRRHHNDAVIVKKSDEIINELLISDNPQSPNSYPLKNQPDK